MVSDVGTVFCFLLILKDEEIYPDMVFANKSPCELPLAFTTAHLAVSSIFRLIAGVEREGRVDNLKVFIVTPFPGINSSALTQLM